MTPKMDPKWTPKRAPRGTPKWTPKWTPIRRAKTKVFHWFYNKNEKSAEAKIRSQGAESASGQQKTILALAMTPKSSWD